MTSTELAAEARPVAPGIAGPVELVVGPKTRLGAELLDGAGAAGVALARDDRDLAALSARDRVLDARADDAAFRAALGTGPVRVHVCALGPVHPAPADPGEAATVERELATIDRILTAAAGREVHVVLTSTVIALAPTGDRRYYAGWKAVVEERLGELVDRYPRASLSVLYPGRLVAGRDARRPWQLAYTTYRRLAALSRAAATGSARHRVVGADARVWLLLRAAALGLTSITGRTAGRGSDQDSS